MDDKRLLEFIRLIARSSPDSGPLEELAKILETQGEMNNAVLVHKAISAYREVSEDARTYSVLTELQLNIAHDRAEKRMEWESAHARSHARC